MPTTRGVRLFGHPVHPMLVHLPMGLLLTAPLWDLLGLIRPSNVAVFTAVGTWTMAVGCLGGLVAAVAGLLDFAALPAGDAGSRAASLHLYLMVGALGLFGTSLLVRHGQTVGATLPLFALDVAGFLLLVGGGFFGAEMVYRHGVGEESSATEPRVAGYHPKEQ